MPLLRRLHSRLLLRRQFLARALHGSAPRNALTNLTLPPLKPTMKAGTITSWRVPEGARFSAQDVLFEFRTDFLEDKSGPDGAQTHHMELLARRDGVLAKILIDAGGESVPVGTRIAVLADVGDDLSKLDLSDASDARVGKTKEEERTVASPSVANLLHIHGLQAPKIAPTGPKGRLLKGDVLAYLGHIDRAYPKELSGRINGLSKLDLSNIKVAAPRPPPATEAGGKTEKEKGGDPAAEAGRKEGGKDPEVKVDVQVSFEEVVKLQAKLQDTLGLHIPISTIIDKATLKANLESLPPPPRTLFEELLPIAEIKHFVPTVSPVPPPLQEVDVLDILTGAAPARSPAVRRPAVGARVFCLSVQGAHEEAAGREYLQRVKTLLEKDLGTLAL